MTEEHLPEGFARHTRASPLTNPWEPLYARHLPGALYLGLTIREAHCNGRGFAHGGLISALADNAMGWSIAAAAGGPTGPRVAVTVNLSMDFLGSGQIGQWLEFRPRVLKIGRSLAFVECHVHADEAVIARGNATFKIG